MKQTTLMCDCGCGAAVKNHFKCGWFVLSQLQVDEYDDCGKIDRELYFSCLECVKRWTTKAADAEPGLMKSAKELSPRGKLFIESIPGLYV